MLGNHMAQRYLVAKTFIKVDTVRAYEVMLVFLRNTSINA